MIKAKSILRCYAALVIIFFVGISCAWCEAVTNPIPTTVKIGVILPLTGDMAFAGEDVRNGMILAKERLPKTHFQYQLQFEDNALDLGKSVAAARKLIDVDKVDAVVTLWPPTANVVAPLTDSANILHYTIAWDPAIAQKHKYVLSHQAMVDAFVKATLKLLKEEKVTKLAFFQLNESGFNLGTDILKKLAPSYGIQLSYLDVFNPGTSDFRTELLKAKSKEVDGVLIWAVMPEMATLIKQVKESGIKGFITGFFDVVTDLTTIEGWTFVSEVKSTDEFATLYKERFGNPFSLKAPNAYDIVNLLVMAFEEETSHKRTAQELKSRLTQVHGYSGAVGSVDIDSYGNSNYPPSFKRVEHGELMHAK